MIDRDSDKYWEGFDKLMRVSDVNEAIKIIEKYNIREDDVGEALSTKTCPSYYTLCEYTGEKDPVKMLKMMKQCDLEVFGDKISPEKIKNAVEGYNRKIEVQKMAEGRAKLKQATNIDEAIKIISEYNIHIDHVVEYFPGSEALLDNFWTLRKYTGNENPVEILKMMKKCGKEIGNKKMSPEELMHKAAGLDKDHAKRFVAVFDRVMKGFEEERKKRIEKTVKKAVKQFVDTYVHNKY